MSSPLEPLPGNPTGDLSVKSKHRLDNERLADALGDLGLADRDALKLVLAQAASSGQVFTEILVRENLVSDWEISRVAAEVFNLPFLPVEVSPPSEKAMEGLDPEYLRMYGLVPLDRFGDLLTVAIPGLVPTHVLAGMGTSEKTCVVPVIGTVQSNRNWLAANLPQVEDVPSAIPSGGALSIDSGWTEIFDAGDEAVQLNLQPADEEPQDASEDASADELG